MKAVILGSGSAYGCPMAFNKWRQLNPHNLKNVRNRASVYLEVDGKNLLSMPVRSFAWRSTNVAWKTLTPCL